MRPNRMTFYLVGDTILLLGLSVQIINYELSGVVSIMSDLP